MDIETFPSTPYAEIGQNVSAATEDLVEQVRTHYRTTASGVKKKPV